MEKEPFVMIFENKDNEIPHTDPNIVYPFAVLVRDEHNSNNVVESLKNAVKRYANIGDILVERFIGEKTYFVYTPITKENEFISLHPAQADEITCIFSHKDIYDYIIVDTRRSLKYAIYKFSKIHRDTIVKLDVDFIGVKITQLSGYDYFVNMNRGLIRSGHFELSPEFNLHGDMIQYADEIAQMWAIKSLLYTSALDPVYIAKLETRNLIDEDLSEWMQKSIINILEGIPPEVSRFIDREYLRESEDTVVKAWEKLVQIFPPLKEFPIKFHENGYSYSLQCFTAIQAQSFDEIRKGILLVPIRDNKYIYLFQSFSSPPEGTFASQYKSMTGKVSTIEIQGYS